MSLDPVVQNYLDRAGNHEMKNLMSGVFLDHASDSFTAVSMAKTMNDHQASQGSWQARSTMVRQYCEYSLEPAGVVHRVGQEWQANPESRQLQLALSGFISDWSLRWNELSVQQAFGVTTSLSNSKSPSTRHAIYTVLLSAHEQQSIREISDALELEAQSSCLISTVAQINALTNHGILETATKRRNYDPVLKINGVMFTHGTLKLSETIPETQALYKALGALGVGTIVTLDTLIDAAESYNKDIDPVKLRMLVRQGANGNRGYPGVELIDSNDIGESKGSRVALSAKVKKPIRELVKGIAKLEDPRALEHYGQRTKEINASPEEFRALVDKARQFSSRANSVGRETLRTQLIDQVRRVGTANAASIRQSLLAECGTSLSQPHIIAVLNTLVEDGVLSKKKHTTHPHSKRKENLFSIADQ